LGKWVFIVMGIDVDKIVELGKVLLNTPTLRSIYKDKFEINSIDFEFLGKKTSNSQFTPKYEYYIFKVTLYTDIPLSFDEGIKSGEIEDYDDIDNELYEYGIDPFYLADIIIPGKILNIILPMGEGSPKVGIELSIIGDEGQVIWNDHMFGRPASS